MRFKLKLTNITFSILISSLLLVTVGTGVLMVNYYAVERDYLNNNDKNKTAYNKVNKKLKLLFLKDQVTQLNLDVNIATTSLLSAIRSDRLTKVKSSEVQKVWTERISINLNDLNKGMREYPDEIQAAYYRINDMIDQIRNIHEEFIEDYFRGQLRGTVSDLDEIIKLDLLTKELGTSSKEFLEDFLIYKTIDFVEPKYKEDYISNVVWSSMLFLFVVIFVVYRSSKVLKIPVIKLEQLLNRVNQGDLPHAVSIREYDYRNINQYFSNLVDQLKRVQKYANHVSKGSFDLTPELTFTGKGDFGVALLNMQNSLLKVAQEDEKRSEINNGLERFSEILGNNSNSLEKFGDDVIINLVEFLGANQGALFIVKEDVSENQYLALSSCYAYDKKKYIDKKILKGQGLVGQCWEECERVYMTDVPKDYINITSGLGYSTPRCVLIIPLVFNDEIQGVIEIASFKELEDYLLNFVEKVGHSIASALASVKVNTQTQVLLKQSEQLTKKLKGQEEEMRRNVEELRLTQEESQRREEEHLREISRLRKRLEEYERNF